MARRTRPPAKARASSRAATPATDLTEPEEELFYDVPDITRLFNVSGWTVYYWARTRRLPVMRIGKGLRFPRRAVHRLISRRTEEAR
jgi:excisionase family DNA binding protein